MSVAVSIKVNTADVREGVRNLVHALSDEQAAAAVGPACRRVVHDHLAKLGPNKRGWPSTRFYGRAAKATTWEPVEGGVVVSVNQIGMRQRYRGGVIRAVNRKMLAIPISPVSYGKTPSDFEGLFVIATGKGAWLVQHAETLSKAGNVVRARFGRDRNERRRRTAALNFLFRLKPSVVQAEDKSVLPDDSTILASALQALGDSAEAAWRNKGPLPPQQSFAE